MTEQLDDKDMGFHEHIVARINAEVPRLLEQREAITKRLADLEGARVEWGAYLRPKYDMQDGDQIGDDGTITRAPRSVSSLVEEQAKVRPAKQEAS